MPPRPQLVYAALCMLLVVTARSGSPQELSFDHVSAVARAEPGFSDTEAFGGCGTPLTLASADFDEDGVPDLAIGCAGSEGGTVAIYRGDINALYASGAEALSRRAPFKAHVSLLLLSEPAEFLASGDFDGDGHQDLVSTTFGASAVFLRSGNGQGAFAPEIRVDLPAAIVAMVSGEIHRRDGLADLALALADEDGTQLLIFQASAGALSQPPEVLFLPGKPRAIALGSLVGDSARDLAVATDAGLVIVHGRDRTASRHDAQTVFELEPLPFSLTALTVGNFESGNGSPDEIALLDDRGGLHIYGPSGLTSLSESTLGKNENSKVKVQLLGSRLSGSRGDHLLLLDQTKNRIVALSEQPTERLQVASPPAASGLGLSGSLSKDRAAMPLPRALEKHLGPLDTRVLYSGTVPIAALTMRLDRDSRPDLVLLEQGARGPTALLSRGATIFTVNSTADTSDGACEVLDPKSPENDCTLREAILAANAAAGADTIAFDIPGMPPHTIGILSDLPDVTDSVTIDGRTEPDFAGTPVVVLDGNASIGPSGFGIPIVAGSTVRGLALHRFASHSAIIAFGSSSGSLIEGNFIGTDETGMVVVGTGSGIDMATSSNNTIGGTVPEARNLVAGTTLPAIVIREGSSNNVIQGNYLGLDLTGSVPLQNVGNEVLITDSDTTTFGGTIAGSRNVVAGNTNANLVNVALANVDANPLTNTVDTLVQGNYVGTDLTGNVAIGTASVAVFIQDASNNTVGGMGVAGNVIGGSGLGAVRVLAIGAPATDNSIVGNNIGLGADGTTPLPNTGNGVRFSHSAADNLVENNTITNSTDNGILGRYDAGTGNAIMNNRIFGNGLLGIDLTTSDTDPGGPTANDGDDSDTGPNGLQNFPLLSVAGSVTGQVSGRLNSIASAVFSLEFFMNSACDGSGNGEGAIPLGTISVTTDAGGLATFTFNSPTPLTPGQYLTSTATDSAGSTSEFSPCTEIAEPIFVDGFESGNTSAWS